MRKTWLIVAGLVIACGGKVTSGDSGSGGAATASGTTGTGDPASSTTSSASSTSFAVTSSATGAGGILTTTTSDVMTGTGGATFGTGGAGGVGLGTGGAAPPDDPMCAMFCSVASMICPSGVPGSCTSDCTITRLKYPQCSMLLDTFLKCGLSGGLVCTADRGLQWPSCTEISNALDNCINPPPPPPRDAGPVPICGTVPSPGPCSGGGSSGGSTTTTGGQPTGGQPTCSSQCSDGNHNTWIADCVGNACTCWFNGTEYCQCTLGARACYAGGCCPM
jgi:hypothetical protein